MVLACLGLLESCSKSPAVCFTDIPVQTCSGVPCVEVSLDGSAPLRLVLDLGGSPSYISLSAARKAQLSLPALQPRERIATTFKDVRLGAIHFASEPFAIVDPADPYTLDGVSMSGPLTADGALSYLFFKDRMLVLNLPNHRMRVSGVLTSAASCVGPCSHLFETTRGCFAPYTIATDGFSIDGLKVDARINPIEAGSVIAWISFAGTKSGHPNQMRLGSSGDQSVPVGVGSVAFGGRILIAIRANLGISFDLRSCGEGLRRERWVRHIESFFVHLRFPKHDYVDEQFKLIELKAVPLFLQNSWPRTRPRSVHQFATDGN